MPEVLRRIEAARARGLDVTANQYPYTRASNGLDSCLPLWAREGGFEKTLPRLTDPATRERIKKDMDDPNAATWENQWYGANGGDGVMLSSVLNRDLAKYEGHDADRRSARRWGRTRATRSSISSSPTAARARSSPRSWTKTTCGRR